MGAFPFPDRGIDRRTTRPGLGTVTVLALSCLLLPLLCAGRAECSGPASVQDMDIQHVIDRTPDSRQRAILATFRDHFQKSDSMSVTIHDDHYEIIVSHPSTETQSGGAEQYLLDKKTGRWEMGWHEHPMRY